MQCSRCGSEITTYRLVEINVPVEGNDGAYKAVKYAMVVCPDVACAKLDFFHVKSQLLEGLERLEMK